MPNRKRDILQKPLFGVPSVKDITNKGEIMTKKITKTREEPKAERPWIVSASQTEDGTGNVTIRFVDNTEIVKLGVSHEDYKAFEATFSQKDWQETSLAFLDNELSKYATAE